MAPDEALYGRKCRIPLCWYENEENLILGPDVVQQTLEFQEGGHVFLKVTPMTGVGRAIKSRKLTPRFIGPCQILQKIGPVAYQLALPPFLSNIHNVFHVSQLRKYISDPSHVIEPDIVQIKENLTY